jgi:hypothetical protein
MLITSEYVAYIVLKTKCCLFIALFDSYIKVNCITLIQKFRDVTYIDTLFL